MNSAARDILRAVVSIHVVHKEPVETTDVRKLRFYELEDIANCFKSLYTNGMVLIVGLDETHAPVVVPTPIGMMEVLA